MSIPSILSDLASRREHREALYKDFHRHPELSLQEYRTAEKIEAELAAYGVDEALHTHREHWSGTFIAVFQPGEENAAGAKAMVADGIVDKVPKPDVYLGQHVLGSLPGGAVGIRPGPLFSAAASIEITLHGKGSHGSMPNLGVDPIVLGSAIVGRLQTIVSHEVAPKETAVVTVGSFHAGTKSNIIPDSAVLQLNTRAFNKDVEKHLHEAIERIVRAECEAARSPKPPEFRYYDQYPLTSNHAEPTAKVRAAFDGPWHRGDHRGRFAVADREQVMSAADTAPVNPTGFKGNDSALFGIVLAVVAFWLFAQTTMNIGPLMAEDVGMPMPVMNIAISLSALFSGMFIVVLGGLGDRYGRVKIVFLGKVLNIVGSLLIAFAIEGALATPMILLGRILQGLAAGAIMPCTMALLKACWDGRDRQREVSMWSIGSWGGSGMIAIFGGFMASTVLGWRAIFVICALVSMASIALVRQIPESAPLAGPPRPIGSAPFPWRWAWQHC